MNGTLYIVASPIGHLQDLSQRAAQILAEVDCVLAEDTRVTLKLMGHLGLRKRLYSYHEHASSLKEDKIMEELKKGLSYALVTDAGTPGISDPGGRLVCRALEEDILVVPIPGPSAVTTLLSVFGNPVSSFHFWGFFPIKKKKQRDLIQFFDSIPGVHVFFESPMRILKVLENYFLERDDHMVVGREMTKKYETFYRGLPRDIYQRLKENAEEVRGEFCVGVSKGKHEI